MKKSLLLLLSLLNFLLPVHASAEGFPRIGATYEIYYAQSPARGSWPATVKVLKRGTGGWHLIEFEFRGRRILDGDVMPVEVELRKRWINFDVLLGATEKKETEEIDDGNSVKPSGDERTP